MRGVAHLMPSKQCNAPVISPSFGHVRVQPPNRPRFRLLRNTSTNLRTLLLQNPDLCVALTIATAIATTDGANAIAIVTTIGGKRTPTPTRTTTPPTTITTNIVWVAVSTATRAIVPTVGGRMDHAHPQLIARLQPESKTTGPLTNTDAAKTYKQLNANGRPRSDASCTLPANCYGTSTMKTQPNTNYTPARSMCPTKVGHSAILALDPHHAWPAEKLNQPNVKLDPRRTWL